MVQWCMPASIVRALNWGIICRTGYTGVHGMDTAPGAFLAHYLAHWETAHGEESLLACSDVLELLHPRPTPGDNTKADETTMDAVYHGLLEHRRPSSFRAPPTIL